MYVWYVQQQIEEMIQYGYSSCYSTCIPVTNNIQQMKINADILATPCGK